jgi:hypothetical protein
MKSIPRIAASIALLCCVTPDRFAPAASLFDATMTSGGNTQSRSFNQITELFDTVKNTPNIQAILPNYTDTAALNASFNVRGVPATITMAANSNTITLNVPALGLTQTFAGNSRSDTGKALGEFLKNNGDDIVGRMMKYAAQNTATDPVAGNPTSLESLMVRNNFNQGFLSQVGALGAAVATPPAVPEGQGVQTTNANVVGLVGGYGRYSQSNFNYSTYMLPLSYTWRSDTNADRQVNVRLPITLVEVNGAKSYNAGVGTSVTLPVTKNWRLTPALDYGVVGSIDLGALTSIASGGLTSAYRIPMGKYSLHIGNQAQYLRTLKLSIGQYGADPRIQNVVFTNGAAFLAPLTKTLNVELFGSYTNFTGTSLFINDFFEVGFSFGYTKTESKTKESAEGESKLTLIRNALTDLRLGVTYLRGEGGKSDGFTANVGYYF